MALFTKNKNRAALFGKQTLYDKCCTPEVEECCYLTAEPLPRPPAPPKCEECGFNIGRNYIVNGRDFGNADPITIDISMLPAIIEVFFINNNEECNATFGKITSDPGNPSISISTYSPDIIEPETNELVATIQISDTILPGSYTPYLNYSLCGDNLALGINIVINDI